MPIWWSYPYRQKYPGVWKWCFSLSVMRYNPSVSPAWDEPTSQASQQEEQLWQILDFLLMAFSDISSWRFLPPPLNAECSFLMLESEEKCRHRPLRTLLGLGCQSWPADLKCAFSIQRLPHTCSPAMWVRASCDPPLHPYHLRKHLSSQHSDTC